MGKSYFLMKIGEKKVLFSRSAQKVLGRGVKSGKVGVQQTIKTNFMDGLILVFYMFTWIFSPLSLLWRHWLSKSCYDIIDYQNLKHHSMYFVLTQRGGKYGYSITESGWYFNVFLFTWHMYALLLQRNGKILFSDENRGKKSFIFQKCPKSFG